VVHLARITDERPENITNAEVKGNMYFFFMCSPWGEELCELEGLAYSPSQIHLPISHIGS